MNQAETQKLRHLDKSCFLRSYLGDSTAHFLSRIESNTHLDNATFQVELNQIQLGMAAIERIDFNQLDDTQLRVCETQLSEENLARLKSALELAPKRFDELLSYKARDSSYIDAIDKASGICYLFIREMVAELIECAHKVFASEWDNEEPDDRLKLIIEVARRVSIGIDEFHFIDQRAIIETGVRIDEYFWVLNSTEAGFDFILNLSPKAYLRAENAIKREFGVSMSSPDFIGKQWAMAIAMELGM